jgi:serine/threonine-protein kinase
MEQGECLGSYRLLRRIGSGAMGTVYQARREDEHYESDVAIKVLRSGSATTDAFHRFVAERQILAHLEHPNIARLYDSGSTDDGRPYLVMELVEGIPVDQHCDLHRLTVDQRLVLFQRICAAVQYAHRSLLVHRDLKPANILITSDGEPKLLDFGIAKRLAPELGAALQETRTALRLLTPSHASPEQVRGEAITTASDVYSLGVILYELLTGREPYRITVDLPHEIERATCEQEPERPSEALFRPGAPSAEELAAARRTRPPALARRLRGDLDNIILMALRKEANRRYGSAAQLAEDVARHLQNLPVTARPDTLRYRARKFIRRRWTSLAATAAAVVLVAGSVASLVAQGRQLTQEWENARSALSFLIDTFKQADPHHLRGEGLTAREILDQGASRISRELGGQPDVQAAVMDAIGEVNLGLGRFDQAEPLLTRSLALRRQVYGSGSLEVAESLDHLAGLRSERADQSGAEALLREALKVRRSREDGGEVATAKTLIALGRELTTKGVSPAASPEIEALYKEALALAHRVEGPTGLTVAEALFALADLQRALGNYGKGESLFREALTVEQKVLGDGDPRLWRDRARFADALVEAGKFKDAEILFRQCLEVQRKLLGRDHPDATNALVTLAVAVHLQGQYTEAEALDREALALARSRYGPVHLRVAEILCNLASDLAGQHRSAEAIPLYEEALAIRRHSMGEQHWQVAQVLLLLAQIYRHEEKDLPKALRLARQSYDVFAAGEGPEHPYTAHALLEIGRNQLEQNRFAEAETTLRRCLEIRRKKLEAGHPDMAKVQLSLAKSLNGQGRYPEAAELARAASITFLALFGPDHPSTRQSEALVAEIESRRK